jgi:hypothetical protein
MTENSSAKIGGINPDYAVWCLEGNLFLVDK